MSNHPNRNWRSRWIVDLATCAIMHKPSGFVVSFEKDGNTWVGTPSQKDHVRLLREAGKIYAEALKGMI